MKPNIVLLNPALRELKVVPDSCCRADSIIETRVIGFGYDSRTNDYKVVIVKCLVLLEDGPYIAEVFTLSTNSWKEIEVNVRIFFPNSDYQVVYCNGFCYWYFWDWGCTIVSFDFGDEVFQTIRVPLKAQVFTTEWEELAEWTKIAVWKDSCFVFLS